MDLSFDKLFPGESAKSFGKKLINSQKTYNSSSLKDKFFPKADGGKPIPPNFINAYNYMANEEQYMSEEGQTRPLIPYDKNNYQTPEQQQGPIDTSLALPQQQKVGRPHGGFNGPAIAEGVLGAVGAISSVLPSKIKKYNAVQPKPTYNPYGQGTGSQAIMDSGGELDPNNPTGKLKVSSDKSKNKANASEMLSYLMGQGVNPNNVVGGKHFLSQATEAYDLHTAQNLYNSMIEFSNRPEIKTMSPEQRILTYYDIMGNNKTVGNTVKDLRNISYGPLSNLQNSPDVGLQNPNIPNPEYLKPIRQPIASRKAGGKIKK